MAAMVSGLGVVGGLSATLDPNGAWSLLFNLDSVETPDEQTVVFKLKTENDQTFPHVLTSFPGAIVDEEWLIRLEHEHFCELSKQQKTQDRIEHMLKTGKPLRN